MTGPLLYLTVRSVRNRVRVRLARLRQPRYLAGLVVGGLYFYWFLFGQRARSGRSARGALELAQRYHEPMLLAGSVALLVLMTLFWIWPGRRKLQLRFTRADVQFLMTAPITRSDLIRYKVLRAQLGVLFGAAVMTVFFRPGGLGSGGIFWMGMTVLMAAVNLHMVGVSLFLQLPSEPSGARSVRRWPKLLLVGSTAVVLATGVRSLQAAGGDPGQWLDQVSAGLSTGVAGAALWPWKALVELPLSPTLADFVRHLPVPLGILALNYVWVTRSRAPFEEAAAQMAEQRTSAATGPEPAARRSAGGGRVPFQLSPVGRPEIAILWKNLLMLGRYVSVAFVVRMGVLLVVVGIAVSRGRAGSGGTAVAASLSLGVALFTTLLGPQLARNDLRQDLTYLETLKLWPLRGAELVRGEVLTPTLILTTIVWSALALGTALQPDWWTAGPSWLVGGAVSWALAGMLVASGLILVQVVTHNAIAVAFPAWARIGGGRPQGIDVMGQRMLVLAAMFAVLLVAALPASLVGGVVAAAAFALTGTVPVLAVALPAAVALFVEGIVATEALGALLDRTDPSAIDARE